MGSRSERHGDGLPLEVCDALNGRIQRHQERVARTTKTHRERCDVKRLYAIILREKSVVPEDGRKIGHRDDLESAGEQFIVKLGAGREIDPMDVIGSVLRSAVVRQVFIQQFKFADDRVRPLRSLSWYPACQCRSGQLAYPGRKPCSGRS